MKVLITLVFLYTSLSLAASRVGEWAAYDYEESTPTSSLKGILIKEVLAVKRMKSASGKLENHLQVSSKLLSSGAATKEVIKWEPETQYHNALDLNLYVLKCRFIAKIGKIEKIKVKGGSFNACHVKDQDTWVGVVPFNFILHIRNEPQLFQRYELINYSWKKKK
ncbi:MAG: hypothetical protein JNL11_15595 [Bdellovibrionaceae bacterium]|nr:hypothetical protein [Pseudobdellovibrionaceae bacterium]